MKVNAFISVDVAADYIAAIARHRHITPAAAVLQLRDLIEVRLVDSIRHIDGIELPISSRLEVEPGAAE